MKKKSEKIYKSVYYLKNFPHFVQFVFSSVKFKFLFAFPDAFPLFSRKPRSLRICSEWNEAAFDTNVLYFHPTPLTSSVQGLRVPPSHRKGIEDIALWP